MTTPETIDVVRMVLVGQVGRELVGLINQHGPYAVGLSGEDAGLFTAAKRTALVDGEAVDIGLVGDVVVGQPGRRAGHRGGRPDPGGGRRRPGRRRHRLQHQRRQRGGRAGRPPSDAAKLVVLTDVEGLFASYPDPESVISELTAAQLEPMLPALESGMAPKMEACLRAVRGGVGQAHVIDGRVPHSVLLEVFTSDGVGTMVVP